MIVATALQAQTAPQPTVPYAELERERRRRIVAEQARDQANTRVRRLELERTALCGVLNNTSLLPAERIVACSTIWAIAHERSQQPEPSAYIPLCVKNISSVAGISDDVMSKTIRTLSELGAPWTKEVINDGYPIYNEEEERWSYPFVIKTPVTSPLENLQAIARLRVSPEERKAKTGSSKPGGKRTKGQTVDGLTISRRCPNCNSTNTRIQCQECGLITNTDELTEGEATENEEPTPHTDTSPTSSTVTPTIAVSAPEQTENSTPNEMTVYPLPQHAALGIKGIGPHVAGTPQESTGGDSGNPALGTGETVPPSAPGWLAPRLGDIPQELLDRRQWAVWRAEQRDGKFIKPPINPRTGKPANVNDPATWGTVSEAMQAMQRYGSDGIGFMFTAEDRYTGIDLDQMDDQAREIVSTLKSYTELSPSGRGVHIIVRATKPPGGCRRGPVEVYDRARFLTITGHLVPDSLAVIHDRQDEVNAVHVRLFPLPAISPPAAPSPRCMDDDGELVARMLNAKNGPSSCALWRGDWSGHPSHSEGVWHLLLRLAYWTGGDMSRMDRLLRQSGLYDPEDWDRPDGTYGTHGQRDVQRARDAWAGSSTVGRHDA